MAKFIQGGRWHLSIQTISNVLQWILKTEIHVHVAETDFWRWNATTTGKFSFPSAWNLIRQNGEPCEFKKLTWFSTHCPKMAVCLLQSLQKRLLTKDRLLQLGIIQDNECPLCKSSPETIEHLYFECSYSGYIWTLCKLKLDLINN